jgi:hypothetical protein
MFRAVPLSAGVAVVLNPAWRGLFPPPTMARADTVKPVLLFPAPPV